MIFCVEAQNVLKGPIEIIKNSFFFLTCSLAHFWLKDHIESMCCDKFLFSELR